MALQSQGMPAAPDQSTSSTLLYPFYLDEDMSMAFAAALAGGVVFESEETARREDASKAVRNLRGSLRLFGAGAIDGLAERSSSAGSSTESTLVRRHTAHSIFINLHDELRSSGRIVVDPAVGDLEVGALVSMRLEPAVAPLRRVIDQVLRLLDVMTPIMGLPDADDASPVSRQDRRQRAREAAKAISETSSELDSLKSLRNLFVALRDDLEHSGMIDVVVTPEDGEDRPGVILTLDKRFAGQTALELLHTSNFTVVGKVTQIWPTEDDVALLYRRSVLSLLPALSQQVAVGVFGFLIAMARAIGVVDIETQVNEILGIGGDSVAATDATDADGPIVRPGADSGASASEVGDASIDASPGEAPESADGGDDDDVRVGNDIAALNPALAGPAIQILPLALCA